MQMQKWGTPQSTETLAFGVMWVSTAGHGGMVLSGARNARVPEAAREPDGCYEEDCAWAKAWLALRTAGVLEDGLSVGGKDAATIDSYARETVHRWYPDLAKSLTGEDPAPDNPILQERKDYAEAREKGWFLAVSAVGSSVSNSVPDGMVGAILAPAHASEDRPDRDKEVFTLVPEELYRDSRLNSGLRIFDRSEFAIISHDPFHEIRGDVLSPEEAYDIASQWGSYIKDGDPGAVFYSFPPGDARPQSPEHRIALLKHTQSCRLIAEERVKEHAAATPEAQADWPWEDPKEGRAKIDSLALFFATSEQVEPEHDLALEGGM